MSVEEQLVDLLLNQLGDLVQHVTEVPLKVRLVLGSILLVILALTFLFGQPWPSAAQRAGKRFHDAPRRILVTGAASEIGKQLCAALLAKGHRIIATDRDYRALKALTAQDEGWRNASANLRIKPLNVTQASDVSFPLALRYLSSCSFARLYHYFGEIFTFLIVLYLILLKNIKHKTPKHLYPMYTKTLTLCFLGTKKKLTFFCKINHSGSLQCATQNIGLKGSML